MSTIELHPEKMSISAEGVTPFRGFSNLAKYHVFRDSLCSGLTNYFKADYPNFSRDKELVFLHYANLVCEMMGIFYSYSLMQACRGDKINYENSSHMAMLLGGTIGLPTFRMKHFWNGFRGQPKWKRAFRMLKSRLLSDQMKYEMKGWINPDKIAAFSLSQFILSHADSVEKEVVHAKLDEWFTPGVIPRSALRYSASAETKNQLVQVVAKAYRDCDEAMPQCVPGFIDFFLSSFLPLTDFYLKQAENGLRHLPNEIWIGSSGIIFSRLLAWCLLKRGGRVVAHDHGACLGGWQMTYWKTFNEFGYVSSFATCSTNLAKGYERSNRREVLINERFEGVFSIPEKSVLPQIAPLKRGLKPRTIMFVATCYYIEVSTFGFELSTIVAMDWQARLFHRLSKAGFEILYKPHPLSVCPPPASFDQFGVKVVNEMFHQVYDKADVLLFDGSSSTSFIEALRTDRPMVLIDFDTSPIQNDALKQMEKRVRRINGSFNADGKAMVDWQGIIDAIHSADQLDDSSFVTSYFPLKA